VLALEPVEPERLGWPAQLSVGGLGQHQEVTGVKVLAAVDRASFVTGWVVGPASTEEHWLAEALFRWRQQPGAPAPSAEAWRTCLAQLITVAASASGRVGPCVGG
jgi:hypothetical protein